MDFLTWVRGWLSRHPLKEPSPSHRARFTLEVMERIRALPQPEAQRRPSAWSLPRRFAWPGLALASAAAGVVIVLLLHQQPPQLAIAPRAPSGQAAAPGEAAQPSLVVAESSSEDEPWLEQTLLLLEDLDELPTPDPSTDADEQLLHELQQLDQQEAATRS